MITRNRASIIILVELIFVRSDTLYLRFVNTEATRVSFSMEDHKRHPIPHPYGRAMGCLFWEPFILQKQSRGCWWPGDTGNNATGTDSHSALFHSCTTGVNYKDCIWSYSIRHVLVKQPLSMTWCINATPLICSNTNIITVKRCVHSKNKPMDYRPPNLSWPKWFWWHKAICMLCKIIHIKL